MVYSAVSDSGGTISQFIRYKKITLSHTGILTTYQKKITISWQAGMQANFGDIRFNVWNGTAWEYVPHWLESKTDSVTADVWIKNGYADGDTVVRMYYGNAGLSSDSTRSVFDNYSSDVTTEGQAISSGDYPAEPYGQKEGAFDDVLTSAQSTNNQWFSDVPIGSGKWIGQDFSTLITIVRYRILVGYYSGSFTADRIPYTWRLDGSNSPTFATYDVLDTQTAYTLSDSTWAAFDLDVAGDYRYYRMFITAVGTGTDNYAFVTEMEMLTFFKTATEPTYIIGSEQHQRRAPQFVN